MKNPVWLLKWILKAAIFFTLFAFALNNQHEASVHFFFGNQWRSPMVLIVLAAFAIGIGQGLPVAAARHAGADQGHLVQAVPQPRRIDAEVCSGCWHQLALPVVRGICRTPFHAYGRVVDRLAS